MRSYRFLSLPASIIAACVLAAVLSGRSALIAQDRLTDQYRVFTAGLQAIEDTYVGTAPSDRLVFGAISGLMQTLDPHSRFMDPRSYAQTRERQEGRYYGLGISLRAVSGDLIVGAVYEGTPAYEKGLRRGDVIARIEGKDTRGWTTEQAVQYLKGGRGTFVNISVRRATYDHLIELRARRDEVHIPTVPAAVMLDARTGYIKLDEFGEHSDEELGAALRDLTRKGMQRLVFDLRDNPGGALDQAIRIGNRFLAKGSMIVYTRGRTQNSDQDYRATEESPYLALPMVTLVNRSSASASEIVSGALQDHDRTIVIGETTFGKALVQSVYRVSEGAGASITTARYYTPSGRLIQRPWDGTFDEYLTYTLRDQDANKTHRAEDLKYTDAGRKVYAGGGIEPDHRFAGSVDGFSPSRFARTLAARNMFETYAQQFSRKADTRIVTTGFSGRQLEDDAEISAAMVDEFKSVVKASPVRFDDTAWERDLPYITAMLQKEIDVDLFGVGRAYQNLAKRDPQLQFALGFFPEAQQLLTSNRQSSLQTNPLRQ